VGDNDVWSELQIEPTSDTATIRRAYAKRLRQVHPEDDPEGFQRLRAAYDMALLISSWFVVRPETSQAEEQMPSRNPQNGVVLELSEIEAEAVPDAPFWPEVADEQLRPVLQLISTNQQSAADQFLRLLRSEDSQNLELRLLIEEKLFAALSEMEPFPFVFVEQISGPLGLNDSTSRLASSFPEYAAYRLAGWQAYDRLLEIRDGKYKASALQRRAAQMLTGPFQPMRFQWNRLINSGLTKAVGHQLARINEFAPAALSHHLDQKIVRWWAKRKFEPLHIAALVLAVTLFVVAVMEGWTGAASLLIIFVLMFIGGVIKFIADYTPRRRPFKFFRDWWSFILPGALVLGQAERHPEFVFPFILVAVLILMLSWLVARFKGGRSK
jgi:hypothetical protein